MAKDTALLVIDVQAEMFGGPDPVHRGKELLETLKALIARARVAGVPVVYVQHSGTKGGFLEEGTPGWQTHPDIEPEPGDLVICGIQSEVCVDTTCRSAFNLGYESVLVEDGHTTFDTPDLPAAAISAHENRVLGSYFASGRRLARWFFSRRPAWSRSTDGMIALHDRTTSRRGISCSHPQRSRPGSTTSRGRRRPCRCRPSSYSAFWQGLS